jgi:hypothetical protein
LYLPNQPRGAEVIGEEYQTLYGAEAQHERGPGNASVQAVAADEASPGAYLGLEDKCVGSLTQGLVHNQATFLGIIKWASGIHP